MAAPVPVNRVTPVLLAEIFEHKDGAFSVISLAADNDVDFAEIDPQPFGVEGGEPIMMVNSFNTAWRVKRARQLKEGTPIQCSVHYVPKVLDQIMALINVETVVTQTFGDTGSTNSTRDRWAAFGYLRNFIPQRLVEGQPPVANITVEITNWDYVNHVEAGPNFVSAQGTD